MENRIYKYLLDLANEQTLSLPKGAKVLYVHSQKDTLRLWALVNIQESEMEDRRILIIGTGKPVPADIEEFSYITTVHMCNDDLIWHIFIDKR